jgi:hypothetical protein
MKEAQQGQDTDLKAFAAETLPTLQEHLTMVSQLAQQQEVSQARLTPGRAKRLSYRTP